MAAQQRTDLSLHRSAFSVSRLFREADVTTFQAAPQGGFFTERNAVRAFGQM